jgi:N-acetylglutamate synthase-like GNAT family acetyltransferase
MATVKKIRPSDSKPSAGQLQIVKLTAENFAEHRHFCCRSPKYLEYYKRKSNWLLKRFEEGLEYRILQVDGAIAGFLESIPGEYAWRGVSAPGYLFIHCFWVLGRNKGKGYGTELLNTCLHDARASGYSGVAVLTSFEHWLPNKRIFEKMGFEQVDSAPPAFELYAMQFAHDAKPAHIREGWKMAGALPKGLTLLESDQCPYIHVMAESIHNIGRELGIPVNVMRIETAKQAQQSVCPFGVTGVYYDGQLVSYHPIGPKDLLAAIKVLQA